MLAAKDELFTRPSGSYTIGRSVRFRSSASAYLNRTQGAGNRKIFTLSAWVKRGSLGSYNPLFTGQNDLSNSDWDTLEFNSSDVLRFYLNGATSGYFVTTQVFRDPSAWYHIVVAVDTTQATSTNRVKIYVNGSQITSFTTATYPSQNFDCWINKSGRVAALGANYYSAPTGYFDGYMGEVNFIDGQALTPSSFGSTDAKTGVWQPAKYTGTYGTNGFYLNFSSNGTSAALGTDFSGNSNTWTVNNISVTTGTTYDSMTDVPTLTSLTVANYCVLNPINGSGSITNGNLTHTGSGANWYSVASTIAFDASANFYAEVTIISNNAVANGIQLGVIGSAQALSGNTSYFGSYATGYAWQSYVSGGIINKYNNGTGGNYNGLAIYTTGDVIGIQLNNGTLTFYKNGVSQGSAYTGLSGSFCFGGSPYSSDSVAWNFGQQPFVYTPPTGALRLNTYNLPTSTITNGAAYMAATTYTGTGVTGRAVSNAVNGISMQPDLVWVKSRSSATYNELYDSVRGVSLRLFSNDTSAEASYAPYGVTAFSSGGFSVSDITSSGYGVNENGVSYIGWQWKAGTTSASNTNGTITSTVSVGATQGFSVATYTGTGAAATVGHGLGVAPSMVIVKARTATSTENWIVGHTSLGFSNQLNLNATTASSASSNFNSTTPTSSVFSIGSGTAVNESTKTYVAYVFSAVAGYSAFGSYTGNGSSDGPFVYLGFRPRYIMVKKSSGTSNWQVLDSSRSTYNLAGEDLLPNDSGAEKTIGDGYNQVDFLSNGFKIRNTNCNDSGGTYIYACFAENPFKNALAR